MLSVMSGVFARLIGQQVVEAELVARRAGGAR
jgi:hypothetical protein